MVRKNVIKKGNKSKKLDIEKVSITKSDNISLTEQNDVTEKPENSYCICDSQYDPSMFYIGCDKCEQWYHGKCVRINEEFAKFIDKYFCYKCINNKIPSKGKFVLKNHLVNNNEVYINPLDTEDPNMYYAFNPNKSAATSRQKKLQNSKWRERNEKISKLTRELNLTNKRVKSIEKQLNAKHNTRNRSAEAQKKNSGMLAKLKKHQAELKIKLFNLENVPSQNSMKSLNEDVDSSIRNFVDQPREVEQDTLALSGEFKPSENATASLGLKPMAEKHHTLSASKSGDYPGTKKAMDGFLAPTAPEDLPPSPIPKSESKVLETIAFKAQIGKRPYQNSEKAVKFPQNAKKAKSETDPVKRQPVAQKVPKTANKKSLGNNREALPSSKASKTKQALADINPPLLQMWPVEVKATSNKKLDLEAPLIKGSNPRAAVLGDNKSLPENTQGHPVWNYSKARNSNVDNFDIFNINSSNPQLLGERPPYNLSSIPPPPSADSFQKGGTKIFAGGNLPPKYWDRMIADSLTKFKERIDKTRREAIKKFNEISGMSESLAKEVEETIFDNTFSKCSFWFDEVNFHSFDAKLEDKQEWEKPEGCTWEIGTKTNIYTKTVNQSLIRLNKYKYVRSDLFEGKISPATFSKMGTKEVNEIEKVGRYRTKSKENLDAILGASNGSQLEIIMYEKLGKNDMKKYAARIRELIFNLKKNEALVNKISNGNVDLKELAGMSGKDLASPEQSRWIENVEKEMLLEKIREKPIAETYKEQLKLQNKIPQEGYEDELKKSPSEGLAEDFGQKIFSRENRKPQKAVVEDAESEIKANENKKSQDSDDAKGQSTQNRTEQSTLYPDSFKNKENSAYLNTPIWKGKIDSYHKPSIVHLKEVDISLYQIGGPPLIKIPFPTEINLKMAGRIDVPKIFEYIDKIAETAVVKKVLVAFEVRPIDEDILENYTLFGTYFKAINRCPVFTTKNNEFIFYIIPPDLDSCPQKALELLLKCNPPEGCLWSVGIFQNSESFQKYTADSKDASDHDSKNSNDPAKSLAKDEIQAENQNPPSKREQIHSIHGESKSFNSYKRRAPSISAGNEENASSAPFDSVGAEEEKRVESFKFAGLRNLNEPVKRVRVVHNDSNERESDFLAAGFKSVREGTGSSDLQDYQKFQARQEYREDLRGYVEHSSGDLGGTGLGEEHLQVQNEGHHGYRKGRDERQIHSGRNFAPNKQAGRFWQPAAPSTPNFKTAKKFDTKKQSFSLSKGRETPPSAWKGGAKSFPHQPGYPASPKTFKSPYRAKNDDSLDDFRQRFQFRRDEAERMGKVQLRGQSGSRGKIFNKGLSARPPPVSSRLHAARPKASYFDGSRREEFRRQKFASRGKFNGSGDQFMPAEAYEFEGQSGDFRGREDFALKHGRNYIKDACYGQKHRQFNASKTKKDFDNVKSKKASDEDFVDFDQLIEAEQIENSE